MRLCVVMAVGLAVSGCGVEADSQPGASPGETESAPTAPQPRKNKGIDTIALAEEKFGGRFYSYDEAMKKEVFGLRLNMTLDEARTALEAKGFHPDTEGLTVDRAARDLTEEIGMPPNYAEKIGHAHRWARAWIRLPDDADPSTFDRFKFASGALPGAEILQPYFYVDASGTQRLIRIEYAKLMEKPINPSTSASTIEQKLGEPTNRGKTSYHQNGEYLIQLPIPQGYEASGKTWQSGFDQHPVKQYRTNCLSSIRARGDTLADYCGVVMEGDAGGQRLYDALEGEMARMGGLNSIGANLFMSYGVDANWLRIAMSAKWLPRLIKAEAYEKERMRIVAEQRASNGRTADAPEGL